MNSRFIFELDEQEDDLEFKKRALFRVFKNQLIIDTLYDEVFRPTIKYSEDDKEIEIAEKLWKKCEELIDEI